MPIASTDFLECDLYNQSCGIHKFASCIYFLLLINRARWPYWAGIYARGLSGTDPLKWGPYKKDSGQVIIRMMTSAQVVETSVNVTTNSPSQDYTHPDDHNLPTYKKFIIWLCLKLYYLKIEPWWIGANETVYRKAFKTQQFYLTHKN